MTGKPTYEELEQQVITLKKEHFRLQQAYDLLEKRTITDSRSVLRHMTEHKRTFEKTERLNRLNEALLGSAGLREKLKLITNQIVEIFNADFARIWIIKPGDLCDSECSHAEVTKGPHVCLYRERCLHLLASSGRYTHIDGEHRRVPFGCYKIGKIAAEEETKFLTNDIQNAPRIHDREWARTLGLVSFAGYRLLSANGRVVGVLALFSDRAISLEEDAQLMSLAVSTARVIKTSIAEEALRESEERYKLLAEHSADVIYKVNLETEQYTYASPSATKLLGYTTEEILSLNAREAMPPESYSKQRSKLEKAIMQGIGGPEIFEVDILHKDGHTIPVEIHVTLLPDEQGNPVEILGVARDITARKRAEQALADSEQRLSDIIEFLPDPTLAIDIDGRVIAWNRAMERATGILKQEMMGKGNHAYTIPFYGKPRPVLIDMALKRHEQWEKEYLSLREDDGLLIASESFHPAMGDNGRYYAGTACKLYNAQGDVVGAIETIRDITDAKRLEQERERLITELQEAMAKVRTLSGFLPICASCKKIRDDKGYWNQIEVYIGKHSDAEFSHGICPDCAKKLYPEFDIYD